MPEIAPEGRITRPRSTEPSATPQTVYQYVVAVDDAVKVVPTATWWEKARATAT